MASKKEKIKQELLKLMTSDEQVFKKISSVSEKKKVSQTEFMEDVASMFAARLNFLLHKEIPLKQATKKGILDGAEKDSEAATTALQQKYGINPQVTKQIFKMLGASSTKGPKYKMVLYFIRIIVVSLEKNTDFFSAAKMISAIGSDNIE